MTAEITDLVRDFGETIRTKYGRRNNHEFLHTTPYNLYSELDRALSQTELPKEITDLVKYRFATANPPELRDFDTQRFYASKLITSLELALADILELEPVH